MLKKYLYPIIAILATPFLLIAQPGVELLVNYDMLGSEQLLDIYTLRDGSFAMAGVVSEGPVGRPGRGDPIIIKTDENGNPVWRFKIELAGNTAFASTIVQADNGDFVCGGTNEGQFCAFRVTPDGQLVWFNDYWSGKCWGIIELKNGDFVLAGDHDGGCLIRIDAEGEIVWRAVYTPGWLGHLFSLRETDDGIVAAGYGKAGNNQNCSAWAIKASVVDGGPIWNHLFQNEGDYICYSMTSSGDGGFALAGTFVNAEGSSGEDVFVLRINRDGDQVWMQSYPRDNFQYGRAITRLIDGGFAIVGESTRFGPPYVSPYVLRIDAQGSVRWESTYRMQESERFDKGSNIFWGVTTGLEDEIIACGSVKNFITGNADGFLMKLGPDLPNATYLNYTPHDTVFSVLPDTTITFTVTPRDIDPMEFGYIWAYLDTVRSNDTTCNITFTTPGEQIVECNVTQGEVGTTLRWHINVTDLYIYSYSPDTLNLQSRRANSVGFSIDSVATTIQDQLRYHWTRTNLENFAVEELDTNSSISVSFDRGGVYKIEGLAYIDESRDLVQWFVQVNSTVRDYWPATLNFTVPYDTTISFGIDPVDPGAPNLHFKWSSDTLSLGDSSLIDVRFNVAGVHPIQVIISDSVTTDTLAWRVLVEEPDGVTDHTNLLPTVTKLALAPNPFNAQTTINYALPTATNVKLMVFDATGRQVATLVEGRRPAGKYAAIWNAVGAPAGIYVLKLETSEATIVTKAVMLK